MPARKGDGVLLVPDMVAGRHHIGARIDGLQKDVLGDAEAAGGVLAVDDDEVELQIGDQTRQAVPDGHPPGLAHHVTQKQKPHAVASPMLS